MKKINNIEDFRKENLRFWNQERPKVFDELSDQQTMFCCCGKLATGLHESNCRKFNKKVDQETAIRMKNEIERINNLGLLSSESTGKYPTDKV